MLTLFHAPHSRSSTVLQLIHEMGIADQIDLRRVDVQRMDGSGRIDPANPHPEGKVPYLLDGATPVRERGAIMLHLTDLFPKAGLGCPIGDPQRGEYLSWLFYYQGVVEPVIVAHWAQISHPAFAATFREYDAMIAQIEAGLRKGPWLLGARMTAADLLMAGPFAKFAHELPPMPPAMTDWVARYEALPSSAWLEAQDAA